MSTEITYTEKWREEKSKNIDKSKPNKSYGIISSSVLIIPEKILLHSKFI